MPATSTTGLASLTLVTKHFGSDAPRVTPTRQQGQHQQTVPNYSHPRCSSGSCSAAYPQRPYSLDHGGRSSLGSSASSAPGMVTDEESEVSSDEDHQYHISQSKLFDSFWDDTPLGDMKYPALLDSPEESGQERESSGKHGYARQHDDIDDPTSGSKNQNSWSFRSGPAHSPAKPPPRYKLFPEPGKTPPRLILPPRSTSLQRRQHQPPLSPHLVLPPIATSSAISLPMFSPQLPSPTAQSQLQSDPQSDREPQPAAGQYPPITRPSLQRTTRRPSLLGDLDEEEVVAPAPAPAPIPAAVRVHSAPVSPLLPQHQESAGAGIAPLTYQRPQGRYAQWNPGDVAVMMTTATYIRPAGLEPAKPPREHQLSKGRSKSATTTASVGPGVIPRPSHSAPASASTSAHPSPVCATFGPAACSVAGATPSRTSGTRGGTHPPPQTHSLTRPAPYHAQSRFYASNASNTGVLMLEPSPLPPLPGITARVPAPEKELPPEPRSYFSESDSDDDDDSGSGRRSKLTGGIKRMVRRVQHKRSISEIRRSIKSAQVFEKQLQRGRAESAAAPLSSPSVVTIVPVPAAAAVTDAASAANNNKISHRTTSSGERSFRRQPGEMLSSLFLGRRSH